jgi:hypothetical protein
MSRPAGLRATREGRTGVEELEKVEYLETRGFVRSI